MEYGASDYDYGNDDALLIMPELLEDLIEEETEQVFPPESDTDDE